MQGGEGGLDIARGKKTKVRETALSDMFKSWLWLQIKAYVVIPFI